MQQLRELIPEQELWKTCVLLKEGGREVKTNYLPFWAPLLKPQSTLNSLVISTFDDIDFYYFIYLVTFIY